MSLLTFMMMRIESIIGRKLYARLMNGLNDFLSGFAQRRSNVRRFPIGGYSGLTISQHRFADVITATLLDMVCDNLAAVSWSLQTGDSRTFVQFVDFFREHSDDVIQRLYSDGYAAVDRGEDGFFRLRDNVSTAEGTADYVFYSADFKRYENSTAEILKPFLNYLDNIINAANTSIKRLGVMAFLMPHADTYGNGLTAEELDAEEKKLQTDYGILDDQKIIKITSHDYSLGVLNIGGASLQLDSRLQHVIKIICGKLRIPYELLPAAIIGNPNQTGVYQQEAMKRLFNLIFRYCEDFARFAKAFGLAVDYDCVNAPHDYESQSEDLTAKILANLQAAEKAGYISHEEATAKYAEKISAFD